MKYVCKTILLFFVVIMPVLSYAQSDSLHKHHVKKGQGHTETKKQLTPEEKKKAAIKRTLKEKNFHLPDTTVKHKAAK